jgi:Xaa-Pro aminopeptidase
MKINRIKQLIRLLKHKSFLVTSPADQFYLTGSKLTGYYLLAGKKGVFAFTSELMYEQLKKELLGIDVFYDKNIIELLIRICKKHGIKSICVDDTQISRHSSQTIASKIKVKFVKNPIRNLRIIKDAHEIQQIKKACKIAKSAMHYAKSLLKPGITEKEILLKIELYLLKLGLKPSFDIIVASGPNSAFPHHISSDRKVAKQDIITIDLGCVYNGYCSDLTRTFFFGKINKLYKTVFRLVAKAKTKAESLLRSGIKADSIDLSARKVISSAGFGKSFIHSTGHGVGIEIHEEPRLSRKSKTVLKSGMVVTVEPGIYIKGKFGVRIEDTLLITRKGSVNLTK